MSRRITTTLAARARTLTETTLTQANVNSQTFSSLRNYSAWTVWWTRSRLLYLSQLSVAVRGVYNVAFIATEHDSVYAFDSDTGAQLWKVSLLGSGETTSDNRGLRPDHAGDRNYLDAGDRSQCRHARDDLRGGHVEERIDIISSVSTPWMSRTARSCLAGSTTVQGTYPGTGAKQFRRASGGPIQSNTKSERGCCFSGMA